MPGMDHRKELIGKRFSRRIASYDEAAVVQRSMAQMLVEQLSHIQQSRECGSALELGCGTGVLTRSLLSLIRLTLANSRHSTACESTRRVSNARRLPGMP